MQNYENYWSLTNAYTDYHGAGFLSCLKTCVEFIDEFKAEKYSPEKYSKLQLKVQSVTDIGNLLSVRKAINQLVKLGFINSFLVSYHADCPEYLKAKTNKKRASLLSKIVYSNSSFSRAINESSSLRQLNFLIRTLVENGKLTKSEIIALMLVDIEKQEKGFLTAAELAVFEQEAQNIGFIDRKYNQINYLFNLLQKLDDIVFVENILYFQEDAKRIFGDEIKEEKKIRDPYLHRLYKNQLQIESIEYFADTKCMVEKLAYPVLIASHIKPFIKCDDTEAYNVNNGILLSRNIDSLFDLGYITFDNLGNISTAEKLDKDLKKYLTNYKLDTQFLNPQRLTFLEYHRKEVFEKRYRNN
jgi:putative restriction endonuclease